MSSLYRCRARVAYKPFKSERVIVFEEKQIQDLQVKLKGNNTFSSLNSQGNNSAEAYAASIAQSKCQVTLSDPYLTGIAWPALFDAASQWSASNTAQTNNILLPPCGENQDPVRDKCYNYSSIDSSALISSSGSAGQLSDSFAHVIISLWYDVNGTSFGTDYYFRVNRISINHGGNFPSVTLSGTEPRAVVFNQNLINVKFDEGMSVEEALKKIAEENGYKTSFCVPPGGDTASPYILPRSLIYKGVTPDEAMKRLIGATGGSMLSLPVKEYGNRVSVCSRGEITSSCTVFYLGKGLYESYVIDGEPPDTFAGQNSQTGATINDGDPYVSASFAADKYSIKEVIKEKRIKALEKVKKVTFPDLFKSCEPRCQGQLADGYGWSGEGPTVQNTRYTKSNFYGVAPNGTQAISYLPGKVESASEEEGKVVIKTEMWFQICKDDKSEKCFGRYIYQESSNLTKVKIKRGDELKVSQEIGSSTDSKKELVRFYIQGHSQGDFITVDPRLIWNWSAPAETAADFQNKNAPTGPGNSIVTPAPKQSLKDWKATTTAKPSKVLLMAGHADFPSGAPNERELNIELVKWAQRNAQAYGISDYIEVYLPSSSNLPESDPRSQFSKTSQAANAGKQIIEIHNDAASGHSGVIPPTGGKRIWQLDESLASSYGSFSVNHRDGLGVPKRGGTILEVGRMDGGTTRVFTSGTPAQKEALYKQLMDPVMRSIAQEKARNAGTAAPASSSPSQPAQGSAGFDGFVGRVGSTGSSSGPHLHAEKFPLGQRGGRGQPITSADVDPYVSIGGTPASTWGVYSPYGPRSSGFHYGIDFSGPGPGGKNINGQPITITGGAQVLKTGFQAGYGNYVEIRTPAGYDLLLAHLQDQSIPPNLPGLTSSASGGNVSPTISQAPSNKSLTIETSFKGVPRALRITPGRTILSFITDYDKWVDNSGHKGGDNSTDPGVWIPNRFRNWFINEVEYLWRQGDLEVNLQAANPWGNSIISAPTFAEYLSGQRKAGEFEKTNDYYGYIRSVGDLCFPITKSDGKLSSSCKELCKEAQEFYRKYGADTGTTDGTGTGAGDGGAGSQTGFPVAKCQYTGTKYDQSKVNRIINAAYSGGIRTNIGLAGVVANAIWESRLDPKARGDSGDAWGIFQWNSRRPGLIAYAQSVGGDPNNFDVQMGYFVKELKSSEAATVPAVNGAKTLAEATTQFERKFERAGIPRIEERIKIAGEIFPSFNCQ